MFITRLEFRQRFVQSLIPLYDQWEAQALFRRYVEERLGVEYYLFLLDMNLPAALPDGWETDLERLASGEPFQYVMERTEFCGLPFKVTPAVLIPRPETEELVAGIVSENAGRTVLSVLDIGTGSGAIAVTLAKNLPAASVTALDVSDEALMVAAENAETNNVSVRFLKFDILGEAPLPGRYDLIVSNPPYVPERDRAAMHRNVLEHEPALALFVPDDRPLLFYEAIAEKSATALNPGGRLYLETHEDYHPELKQLLENHGFVNVECRQDLFGRPRFVVGQLGE
jgi:release factor glutamine methyltransferase